MRKVKILIPKHNPDKPSELMYVDEGNERGIFIQYGTDFEEFSEGAVQITTAIVEMPDGTVKNIDVKRIKFYQ